MTPLDQLCPQPFHQADEAGRARYLQKLADTEVFVALAGEAVDNKANLRLFDLTGMQAALACDSDERLADFLGQAADYAAMPGRVLAAMLAGRGLSLLVNPGQPSEALIPPEMLNWLVESLSSALPEQGAGERPSRLTSPAPLLLTLLAEPLAERLASLRGHVHQAALVGADWPGGGRGHIIALSGVEPADRGAVAKSMAEMLAFLPVQDQRVDIAFDLGALPDAAFVLTSAPVACGCGQDHGPDHQHDHQHEAPKPKAPGLDPAKPPILRF
ncbi:MAG: SseB family protein [Paracoccus sp. (in: a-proteobacteria)]|uniref:SseB family protein n=1 Tax=Paracoccus sp. TaxID=267 RepID=UPI0026DF1B36|nr:SseB family protein [Paracoccus sp. (in: a-proteobacteria)]MDO5622475.1 SseB family protein [Paracoccus sp. (in: a-proteobacteria)]